MGELPEGIMELDLTSTVNGMNLDGKLTLPEEEGKYPCVILVHGSGPNDMDESVGSNAPFRDIAYSLAQKGIAVYRYNKSTYQYPENFISDINMTLEDETVNDAVEIFKLIKENENIDSDNVYILGHSLGGNAIPLIAERTSAAGYIIMAGNSRPLEDLMLEQIEYLINADGVVSDAEKEYLDNFNIEFDKIKNIDDYEDDEVIMNVYVPYWRYLGSYDPLKVAEAINEDVLVLQGLRDYQVTIDDYNGWYDAFSDYDNWTFRTYEKLNHLMMEGEGPSLPAEYNIASSVDETLLEDIAEWILN